MIQNKTSKKSILILFISGCLLFTNILPGYAATQVFTGVFTEKDDRGSGLYAEIPITIDSDSEVSLYFGAGCENPDNFEFRFNTTTNPYGDDYEGHTLFGNAETAQPLYDYYAMKEGNHYFAMIFCRNQGLDPNVEVEYSVTVSNTSTTISSAAEDTEPDSYDDVIDITASATFEGWLGFMGYPETPGGYTQRMGSDSYDSYIFNMEQGAKVQFKLEYDDFKSNNGGLDVAFRFRIYRLKDNNTYFVHEFANKIVESGQISEQITLLESGTYLFYVAKTAPEVPTDGTKYGGYHLSVIIDGEPEPEPEPEPEGLFLTFRQATWVKKTPSEGEPYYNLVVKCQVENTYNESKTFKLETLVDAAVLRLEGNARALEKEDIIDEVLKFAEACEFGKINFDQLCEKQGDLCIMAGWRKTFTYSYTPLPPHSKQNYTLSLPVTLAEYKNFDQGLQIVRLAIEDIKDPEIVLDCYTHGLYYMPGWGYLPGVELLLRRSLVEEGK